MTKGILQGNPFEPTDVEAVAITNVGLMFAHILILLVILCLMIYYSKRLNHYTNLIVIYLFSIVIGFESFLHIHTPFSPMIEIFFVILNTTIFINSAIDFQTLSKRKKGIN